MMPFVRANLGRGGPGSGGRNRSSRGTSHRASPGWRGGTRATAAQSCRPGACSPRPLQRRPGLVAPVLVAAGGAGHQVRAAPVQGGGVVPAVGLDQGHQLLLGRGGHARQAHREPREAGQGVGGAGQPTPRRKAGCGPFRGDHQDAGVCTAAGPQHRGMPGSGNHHIHPAGTGPGIHQDCPAPGELVLQGGPLGTGHGSAGNAKAIEKASRWRHVSHVNQQCACEQCWIAPVCVSSRQLLHAPDQNNLSAGVGEGGGEGLLPVAQSEKNPRDRPRVHGGLGLIADIGRDRPILQRYTVILS